MLQGWYGDSWSDLVEYDKADVGAYKEAKSDLKCYRENEKQYSHRVITRRELNN